MQFLFLVLHGLFCWVEVKIVVYGSFFIILFYKEHHTKRFIVLIVYLTRMSDRLLPKFAILATILGPILKK